MSQLQPTLKELHALLTELAEARETIQRNPQVVKAKTDEMARKEERFAKQKDALRHMRMAADSEELSLKTKEQRVKDLRGKLNAASSNKEYSAINEEIGKLTVENGLLADEILSAIGRYDDAAVELEQSRVSLEAARTEFAKFKEKNEYTLQKLRDRSVILEKKIADTEASLDSESAAMYQRLLKIKGHRALGAVEGDICTACYTSLTPQGMSDLRSGKMVICKSCGAMLYA